MTSLTERKMAEDKEPLTERERKSRNMLMISGALGGAIGLALALLNLGKEADPFSNGPISPVGAVILALLWGLGLPLITKYWNRYIDEQEADAYRWGTYYGFMVYGIGAPVWWILARASLVPPINGVILYYAVLMTCGFVWLRKKYG